MTQTVLRSTLTVCVLLAATVFPASTVNAQVPQTIAYQGYLTDAEGTPIEGTATLQFSLYADPLDEMPLWSESQTDVTVTNGVFSVRLGRTESLAGVSFDAPLWLGIQVNGGDEMTPRTALTAVPYALSTRGLRHIPAADPSLDAPRFIAGSSANSDADSDAGSTIGGGGSAGLPNTVTGSFGTVSGGRGNAAGQGATVGGGSSNRASAVQATVGGGGSNEALRNVDAVGGGGNNTADGPGATISGGASNVARGAHATVGGGASNKALARRATVPGGFGNNARGEYSLAAGRYARAVHDGSFVWSDNSLAEADSLHSTAPHQFLIRAAGGVGIGTNSPSSPLTVAGMIESTLNGFKFPDGTVQQTAASSTASAWQLGGNRGTSAGTHFLGTTDEQPLEFRINSQRVLRLEFASQSDPPLTAPNVIAGYETNSVDEGVVGATISGGGAPNAQNSVTGNLGTVGGGLANAAGSSAAIGGGQQNAASGVYARVGGGRRNEAGGDFASVGGGDENAASGAFSTIRGGNENTAGGGSTTVGGGVGNSAEADWATVGGGAFNKARDEFATVGGGNNNKADGTAATVRGGESSHARGSHSFAAGFYARSAHDGAFVWSDKGQSFADSLVSTAENQFLIRARGGIGVGTDSPAADLHIFADSGNEPHLLLEEDEDNDYARLRLKNTDGDESWDVAAGAISSSRLNFFTSAGRGNVMSLRAMGDPLIMHNGAKLTAGGTWTNASSRLFKTDFRPVDAQEVLSKLVRLPVQTWRYRAESDTRHLGPTAEGFSTAFGLGDTDKAISTVDADGVAFAAIQALHQLVELQQEQVEALRTRVAELERLIGDASAQNQKTGDVTVPPSRSRSAPGGDAPGSMKVIKSAVTCL